MKSKLTFIWPVAVVVLMLTSLTCYESALGAPVASSKAQASAQTDAQPPQATSSHAPHADWAGEYFLTTKTENEAETWMSGVSVSDCTDKSCKFTYSSGSMQSDCAAEGSFTFKSASRAEFTVDVKAEDEDSPRGQCLLTFEKKKGGKLLVDSKDIFKSPKDEAFGNVCNTLCGFQGARYFGVEMPKVSDVKFYNPSFSCIVAKLTTIEKQICTSEKLSKLDRDLSTTVAKKKSDDPKSVARLTTDQRAWMKEREAKCGTSENREPCLIDTYESRLKVLQAGK